MSSSASSGAYFRNTTCQCSALVSCQMLFSARMLRTRALRYSFECALSDSARELSTARRELRRWRWHPTADLLAAADDILNVLHHVPLRSVGWLVARRGRTCTSFSSSLSLCRPPDALRGSR